MTWVQFRRQEPQLAAGRRIVVRTPAGRVLVTRVLELDGTRLRLDNVTEVLVGTSVTVLGDHADGPWAASAIVTAGPPLSIALRELPRTLPERRAVPRLTEGPRLTATVLRGARVGAGIAVGGPLVDLSPHGVAFARARRWRPATASRSPCASTAARLACRSRPRCCVRSGASAARWSWPAASPTRSTPCSPRCPAAGERDGLS